MKIIQLKKENEINALGNTTCVGCPKGSKTPAPTATSSEEKEISEKQENKK